MRSDSFRCEVSRLKNAAQANFFWNSFAVLGVEPWPPNRRMEVAESGVLNSKKGNVGNGIWKLESAETRFGTWTQNFRPITCSCPLRPAAGVSSKQMEGPEAGRRQTTVGCPALRRRMEESSQISLSEQICLKLSCVPQFLRGLAGSRGAGARAGRRARGDRGVHGAPPGLGPVGRRDRQLAIADFSIN